MNHSVLLTAALLCGSLLACADTRPVFTDSECEIYCEEAQHCGGGNSEFDCAAACEEIEQEAADAGCSNELADLLSCVYGSDDICDPAIDCTKQMSAYGDCLSEHDKPSSLP